VADSCEYGDELADSGANELVTSFLSGYSVFHKSWAYHVVMYALSSNF
jgi:hypothetical protein